MREGSHRYIILLLAAFAILFVGASASYAMDPPHVGATFACDKCHGSSSLANTSGATIDDTPYNLLCRDCHVAGQEGEMTTHSSIETGQTARPGPWTYECRNCHNPHYQQQYWMNQSDYPDGAKLTKGKIVSITDFGSYSEVVVNTMAGVSPNWSNNKWSGYFFQPNKNEPYLYRIDQNTGNMITTASNVVTSYYGWTLAGPGNEFGIGNTTLIRDEIYAKFPVINSMGGMVENTKWRPVKFLNATGSTNSLAAAKDASDAVCVVCHTKTKALNYGFAVHPNEHSFQRGATLFDKVEYDNAYSHDNKVSDSRKCFDNGDASCHTGHDSGYSQGGSDCGVCHGGTDGMDSDSDLVKQVLDASSQYQPAATLGSIWAHPKHMEMGLECDDCHDKSQGGMNPPREQYPIGDYGIFMSFGSHDGPNALYNGRTDAVVMNGFAYNGPASPGQTMAMSYGSGSMECQNLYCHSDGGNFAGSISYPSSLPAWDTPFAAEPTCNKCHGNSAGDANLQANYVSTNLHDLHTDGGGSYGYTCNKCHNLTVNSQNVVISNSMHVDGIKNVIFSDVGTYTRGSNGTCSVYCHSDTFGNYRPANWDGSTGSLDCGGCHNKAGDAGPTWSTPHTEHVNTTTYGDAGRTYQITCNACHSAVAGSGSSISDTALHVNSSADVAINATDFGGSFNGGTCSNVKCHSTDGHSGFVDAHWSDGSQGCAYCHGEAKDKATMESEALLSPAHAAHLGTAAGEYGDTARIANTITCGNCHKGTTDDGSALNAGGLINHVNFANNIVFDISSINSSAGTWGGDVSKTCSSNYCHGTNMPFGSNASITNQGTGMTPDWSDTGYISGNPTSDCAQCHGFPPSEYTGYQGTDSTIHDKVGKDPDNCVACHDHLNDEIDWPTLGQWNNIALHIDGVVQYTSCSGCHGQPPLDATTIISNPEYTLMTAGAHKPHFDNGIGDQQDECDVCHLGGGANGGHPYSYEITMGFMANVAGKATYQGASTINSVYNAGSGDDTTTTVLSPVDANRYCNNIYCHSDGGDFGGTYSPKQANWDGSALGCNDCHGDATHDVITDAHPKHVAGSGTDYSFECRECHFETVDATPDIINPSIHVDSIKNVVFSAGGVTKGGSYTRPACDSTYCHSDGMGTNDQPEWNSASTGACGTCHGVDGYAVANIPTSAAHDKHLLVSEGYKFECEKCHTGIVADSTDSTDVPTIASTALHVDGFPNAVLSTGDPLVGGTATWNDSANECSNVYCHSDGAGTTKTQAWSGSLDCSGCHDAAPATGRHTKHLSAASGYQYECFECHGATVNGANAIIGNHVNVVNDVAWGNISSGSDAYSEPGNTCANVYCHSDGVNASGKQTADWDDPNSGQCGDCHGVDATTMPASGAHILHVNTPTGNDYKYECDRCHYNIVSPTADSTVVPALLDNSVHVDGTADVAMHLTDIQSGGTGTSSSWDSPTGRCSNTYCHGADVGRASFGGGTDTAPTWGNTSYILGGTSNAQQDCAMCHALPPDLGSHAGKGYNWNVDGSGCTGCHNHLNTTDQWGTSGQWNDITKHLNGVPDGGCEGCHGTPPRSYATLISNPDYTARSSAGAHAKHWDYAGSFQDDCYICHNGGGANETDHPNAPSLEIHMGFTYPDVANNPSATYTAPALSNTFTLYSAISETTVQTGSPWQCDGIYCHSDGGNYDKSSFVYQSPVWDDSFISSYPDTCDQCHGEADGTGGDNYVLSTKHPKHTGTYGYECVLCHTGSVTPSMGIIDNATHVDGVKQIAINGTDSRTLDGSFAMPNCTVYCHSKGDDNSTFSPLSTAQWNASLPTDCTACHGNDASSSAKIGLTGTGAHLAHINSSSFECAECHAGTVSAGDNRTVTLIGNHVNREVNVEFDSLNQGGSYTGTLTPGDARGTCNNVYCHSDGNPASGSRVYNTPGWDDTFDANICDNCHGNDNGVTSGIAYPVHSSATAGTDGSNSHPAHSGPPNNYACSECHYNTTRDDTTIYSGGYHLDGKSDTPGEDVIFNTSGDNASGAYDSGAQTCSTTYCHGAAASPAWGAASLPCDTCHGGGTDVRVLPGSHGIHYDKLLATSADVANSNDSTTTNYIYTCGVCHYNEPHTNGYDGANQAAGVTFDYKVAITGTYNPGSLLGDDNGYEYTSGNNCTSTYCHSMGEGTAGNVNVTWGQVTDSCDNCHGYAAGSTYVIGETGIGSASHKDHINKTSNKIMPDNGCDFCHLDTTGDGSTITDKSMHVNASTDVVVNTTDFGSSANWDSTRCNNVECHSDGKGLGNYGAPEWHNHTIGDCLGCHGGANGSSGTATISAGTALTDAHTVHTGTFSFSCDKCHSQTAIGNTTINNPSYHVNLVANVDLASGGWSDPNCTGTCHGTTSVDWTDNTQTTGDCSICHGMSDPLHTGRDTAGNTGTSDPQVGVHESHLNASHNITDSIACSECHTVPNVGGYVANVTAAGHIDGGGAEMTWGTLANGTVFYGSGSDTGPTYTVGSDGTCENVYCHGKTATRYLAGGDATMNSPDWNTPKLPGTGKSLANCDWCHGYPPFVAPNKNHSLGDAADCSGCHTHNGSGSNHIDGELQAQGEPTEISECTGCHPHHLKRMQDTTSGVVYKHYMNNANASYPQVASGTLGDQTDTNRNCLMCHADHSLFNADLGTGQKRESNLRRTIKTVPSGVTDVLNSGYSYTDTDGGICLSCHVNRQTKAIVGPHGEPDVMPIPFIDNDDVSGATAPDGSGSEAPGQNAVKIVRNSTHNYAVNMNLFNNSSESYAAICLKCHGDSLEKDKQRGADLTNTLSLHQSSRDSLQAVMGSEPKGFFRGTVQSIGGALGNVVTVEEDLTEDYGSGFSFVITNSSDPGAPVFQSERLAIDGVALATNTVYLASAPAGSGMGAGDHYEITKTATSIAEVCFNCHSQGGAGGDGYKQVDGTDFYGGLDGVFDPNTEMPMQDRLEKMYSVFTDYNDGVATNVSEGSGTTTFDDSAACNAAPGNPATWKNYFVEFTSGAHTGKRYEITDMTVGCGSSPHFSIGTPSRPSNGSMDNATYKILKPAFHPLDTRGVHNTMEAFTADVGWNFGNVTDPAGTRHVGCTDCHNTHASLSNPTGEGDFLSFGTDWMRDDHKTSESTEWLDDRWKGYIMLIEAVDSGGGNRRRMIRYITGSITNSSSHPTPGTTYTFATPLLDTGSPLPDPTNRYELIWHDGVTGSGGKGVWGVMLADDSFLVNTPGIANAPGAVTEADDFKKKFDTSFDVDLNGSGLKGKQYMQCFRCHTYYAWGSTGQIPDTPSGHADGSAVSETDLLQEFNVNNFAHHAVLGVGNNQPITPDGNTSNDALNPNWPILSVTASGITDGAVTLSSGSLPRNAIPGWYVAVGGTGNDWYQIVDITDSTHFTMATTNGNPFDLNATPAPASGSGTLRITAGLGNTFVPPFGPWSIIRCSDCHGSTLSDPVGPHASVNKWLIRDAETTLAYEWYAPSGPSPDGGDINVMSYNSASEGTQFAQTYICFNCHRADVYAFMQGGDNHVSTSNATWATQGRMRHGNAKASKSGGDAGLWLNCADRPSEATGGAKEIYWPQFCRFCHGGDKLGGIHGSWLAHRDSANSSGWDAGKRFLNGAAWDGTIPPTTSGADGTCYTVGTSSYDTRITTCAQHAGGTSLNADTKANYDY